MFIETLIIEITQKTNKKPTPYTKEEKDALCLELYQLFGTNSIKILETSFKEEV